MFFQPETYIRGRINMYVPSLRGLRSKDLVFRCSFVRSISVVRLLQINVLLLCIDNYIIWLSNGIYLSNMACKCAIMMVLIHYTFHRISISCLRTITIQVFNIYIKKALQYKYMRKLIKKKLHALSQMWGLAAAFDWQFYL